MKAIISGHRSKHVDEFQDQFFDYVPTLCDNAKESCAVTQDAFLGFLNPAVFQGGEEERLALFRREPPRWLSKEYGQHIPRRTQRRSMYTQDET